MSLWGGNYIQTVCVCFICISVSYVPSTHGGQKGSLDGHGDTDGFELPCGCWKSNLGPVKEQLLNYLVTLNYLAISPASIGPFLDLGLMWESPGHYW